VLVSRKLVPTEAGILAEVGGEIRAAIAWRYLYVAARLPEPTGRLRQGRLDGSPFGRAAARPDRQARCMIMTTVRRRVRIGCASSSAFPARTIG
jgi:hypothetical protein